MKPRRDAWGRLNFWFVLPTRELRTLVLKRMLRLFPELNYVVGWKDKYGWGLQLADCEWAREERTRQFATAMEYKYEDQITPYVYYNM